MAAEINAALRMYFYLALTQLKRLKQLAEEQTIPNYSQQVQEIEMLCLSREKLASV